MRLSPTACVRTRGFHAESANRCSQKSSNRLDTMECRRVVPWISQVWPVRDTDLTQVASIRPTQAYPWHPLPLPVVGLQAIHRQGLHRQMPFDHIPIPVLR